MLLTEWKELQREITWREGSEKARRRMRELGLHE